MTIERERLKPGGKEDDRGWDGWMASPTQWTWVWGEIWGYFMTSCSLNNYVSIYSGNSTHRLSLLFSALDVKVVILLDIKLF